MNTRTIPKLAVRLMLLALIVFFSPASFSATNGICDINSNSVVDKIDINLITAAVGKSASGPNDSRDANHDGKITAIDARTCVSQCILAKCATPQSVPNLVGLTQAAAQSTITGAGLTVGTITQQNNSTVASGSVISQNPASGASVAVGSAIALVVSSGPAPVLAPNVVGLTQAAAQSAITGAGLTVGTITQQNSSTVASGSVISQNPASGASVAVGSAIALVVSSGPAPVLAPNVVGLTQAAAQTAITGAGLTVGTITQQNSGTVPSGNVISQNPAAGASVVVGTAVNLFVSIGPVSSNQPSSIEMIVSDSLIAPDGTISITPIVKDADGTPIEDSNFQFELDVIPVGLVTGNAPVVQDLNVTFPKLVKQLLNQNIAVDPNGDYADANPTDPNYGKETGGKYRITATLAGTSLSNSKEVQVLPTGTAAITVKTYQYAGKLEDVLVATLKAGQNHDLAALAQAQTAMQSINADGNFSFQVLNTTSAMAPPNGYLVTPAQLTARGFTSGAQDGQFATTLQTLITRLRQVKAQLDATDPAALTQGALDALQNSVSAYKQAVQQLQTLQPSVLGVTQQGSNINQQLGTEIPLLLDAIKKKTTDLLAIVATSGFASSPEVTQLYMTGSPKGERNAATPQLMYGKFEGGAQPALMIGLQSPQAMYASTQPVQFLTFFSTMFSYMTDLSGTARANIFELSLSLMNDILNIEAAGIINANSPGGLSIDYVQGSASLSFACPNYSPSTIGGSGFGRNVNVVKVGVIGCIDSQLIRNLATLSVPRNLAAGIRLFNKIVSIANALQRDQGVAAVVIPDFIDEDFIFGGDLLVFNNGWPRVNQGRLPCVGIVIVMNMETGSFAALNANLLGSCG